MQHTDNLHMLSVQGFKRHRQSNRYCPCFWKCWNHSVSPHHTRSWGGKHLQYICKFALFWALLPAAVEHKSERPRIEQEQLDEIMNAQCWSVVRHCLPNVQFLHSFLLFPVPHRQQRPAPAVAHTQCTSLLLTAALWHRLICWPKLCLTSTGPLTYWYGLDQLTGVLIFR